MLTGADGRKKVFASFDFAASLSSVWRGISLLLCVMQLDATKFEITAVFAILDS
jgi:hypothetical protein